MQRFWTATEVTRVEAGFAILLDTRPVRLPGGAPLAASTRALAAAIAAEWDAAPAKFGFDDLPITRLVGTAQDRIAPDSTPYVEGIARYGASDLLCYRATEPRLADRQAAAWNPLLAWAAQALDAALVVTTGVMPVAQPPDALAALARAVAARNPVELAALGVVVPALGSVVLGLAALHGRLDAAEALRLGLLDELFQAEFWGEDAEAAARRAAIAADVTAALRAAALARP